MLVELRVTGFAVIDSLEVQFLRPGLNGLTGETGAGKSMLVKSLSLLLGGKAHLDTIRTQHDKAIVEGAFDLSLRPEIKSQLEDADLGSGDDMLVIRRVLNKNGKHRAYINGHIATLNNLSKIVSQLVEITGQHEHQTLLRPQSQIKLLDQFSELEDLLSSYREKFEETRLLSNKIKELSSQSQDQTGRLEFLQFQIQEIDHFDPKPDEEEELSTQFQRARNSSQLEVFTKEAQDSLYDAQDSVQAKITALLQDGQKLAEIDSALKPALKSLDEAAVLIEDASYHIRDYAKDSTVDAAEVERIEERFSQLKKLQRKYGSTIAEILNYRDRAKEEVFDLENSDEKIKELEQHLDLALREARKLANKLHTKRQQAATKLAARINGELKDLNMGGVTFSIGVEKTETLSAQGFSQVVFLVQNSPNDKPRGVSQAASGGELSRIMLAIKQIISVGDLPMTYLFDEVDAGISGPTAEKVGKKLKAIGRIHQVVTITHLPQVASYADAHFLIAKKLAKGLVHSTVKELSTEERVKELGRLISGEKITDTSIAHAKQLLNRNKKNTATH